MQHIVVPLIYVLTFIVVVLAIQSLANALFSTRDKTRRINYRMTLLDSGLKPDEVYATLVRKPTLFYRSSKRITDLHDEIWDACRQAGLSMSPTYLVSVVAALTLAIAITGLVWLNARTGYGTSFNNLVFLIGCIVLVPGLTWGWISLRRAARLAILTEQIPLALDIVNRAVRAGHPVIAAVKLAASEMDDPIGTEFGLIVDEATYGAELKNALANFARRTGSPDAHFFAVSVGVQFETGGNLVEILAGLANIIRARITLAKRVKALASEGRASAYVLSALPPILIAFLFVVHPSYYTSKFSDPIFWPVAGGVAFLYVLGWVMIARIINIKY